MAYNSTRTSLNLENCSISNVGLKAINAAFKEEKEGEGSDDDDDDGEDGESDGEGREQE